MIYRYRYILFQILFHYSLLEVSEYSSLCYTVAATAAKLLQSCPTLRPHRRQPTRLPHPWDSPGRNTGVGCHFLLQCMKVKSESEVSLSCPTLSNPMDFSPPGSSIHGMRFSRQEYWSGVPLPSPVLYSWILFILYIVVYGSEVKASACSVGDLGSIPGSGRSPGEGNGNPTPVFLPGESHGRRSLVGYSPRGHKESDMTERLHPEPQFVSANPKLLIYPPSLSSLITVSLFFMSLSLFLFCK